MKHSWFHSLLLEVLGEERDLGECLISKFRLAEKYKESLSMKEKIQKSIEVKKEHLRSLQPGLNGIMQVNENHNLSIDAIAQNEGLI